MIQEYLDRQSPFVVIYVDVDNFKPYNDYYSFEQGDQVISAVARVLKESLGVQEAFIGHVGGDDFVVVMPDMQYEMVCQRILKGFQFASLNFTLRKTVIAAASMPRTERVKRFSFQ